MKESILLTKSYEFAIEVVQLGYKLIDKKEFILSKQLIRSGTSICANAEEAQGAYSKKDFHHKLSIAFKEAKETRYWIRLLRDTKWIDKKKSEELLDQIEEILRILGSTIKTLRSS